MDLVRVVEVLASTLGGPNTLKTRGSMIAKASAGTAESSVSVDVTTMSKDESNMRAQAALGQVRLPMEAFALRSVEQASAVSQAGADCSELWVS